MQVDIKPDLIHRLRSAIGHLEAIIQMLEDQAPCDEVLRQICAVDGALHALSRHLITTKTTSYFEILSSEPSFEEQQQALEKIRALIQFNISGR